MAVRIGTLVQDLLEENAAVSALVGSKIYPSLIPQKTLFPAIAYQVVSDIPVNSFDGYTSGLRSARVQVDSYSKSYDQAQDIADAVAAVLGSAGDTTFSAVQLMRRDLYEDSTSLHRVTQDFSIWVREA